jgi:hypothetical protein
MKKVFYVVTWGCTLPDNGQICGTIRSHKKAVADECDKRPGSGKKHRIFSCHEVNRHPPKGVQEVNQEPGDEAPDIVLCDACSERMTNPPELAWHAADGQAVRLCDLHALVLPAS